MKVYKVNCMDIGCNPDCDTTDYILAKNKKQAITEALLKNDNVFFPMAYEIKSIYSFAPKDVIDFLLTKGE